MDTNKLEFQILDWNSYHELDDKDEHVYVIQLFGRTADDKDVCLRVIGFQPHFYVEIPQDWDDNQKDDFIDVLKNKIKYRFKNNPNYELDYDLGKSLTIAKIVQKHKFYNFTDQKKFKFLFMAFKSYTAMREFSNMLSRPIRMSAGADEILYQRYESNIEPHIRFMHINDLVACGWTSIDREHLTENKKYSSCDLSYSINYKYVGPATNHDRIAPLKIMGYDIECISSDEQFCQAHRPPDKIIQIGMTLYRYGSLKCYEQHMLTLKECDPIEDTHLECYDSEKSLLLGFANKIKEIRPDIMAGYNNFGFDDNYIFSRVKLIDLECAKQKEINVENLENPFEEQFLCAMGKLNNTYIHNKLQGFQVDRGAISTLKYMTYFKGKELKSSALGDNDLKFFQIPGIVSIDMMKMIQKDHKLLGYKLDNVSANFITEGVIRIRTIKEDNQTTTINIITKSTKALELHAYVQIMVNDGYSSSPLSEHAKYKVLDLGVSEETDKDGKKLQFITIKLPKKDYEEFTQATNNKLLSIYWTFAKDDMHHTLINSYYTEGNPTRIKQVAKYCLKDCKLVNLLLAKLEIIVNNVGMANVCHVPLSYLISRGQGVKILSLVSKFCRTESYVMPVLKVDNDTETEGYEGATVITPKPSVYFSPIGVLDYSSLYPKSMCERNLSPEMYVNDSQYDNLPGYKYHDIHIELKDKKSKVRRNLDGSPMIDHHRFAQKIDGSFGILPKILMGLLDARASINRRIKEGKDMDPFLSSILNSLQLAYKITANSLYGQTGAPTSPIYFIQIAASTTAIGRERLYFARDTVEKNFPGSEIIYGDSVVADTPIIYRRSNGDIHITPIEKLGENWHPYEQFKALESGICDKEQSVPLQSDCEVWTSNGWAKIKRVIRHKTIKKIYRISTRTGCIDVTEDHSLLDKNHQIIKPADCDIGTELLHGFMDLSESQPSTIGDKIKYDIEGKTNAQCLFYLLKSQGYFCVSVGVRSNNIYKLTCRKSFHDKNLIAIKKKEFLRQTEPDEYVYDLETESGTFHAGIGELIVKNTDSIFINYHIRDENGNDRTDEHALMETIALAKKSAELINSLLPKPQSIVYEKTLWPFILVAKKKYVGYLFENDPKKFFLKCMGIVLKRRDNAPIVKIVVGGIIDCILKTRDINQAVEYTKGIIQKLMDGHYSIDKFIISKTLKSKYKRPQTIAHKVLADRMAQRDPGNKPQVNDRIPFVYVVKNMGTKKKKDILQGDLIEHPDYIVKNNLKIDYLYYLEHQIINPATQFLELMISTKKVERLFSEFITAEWNKRLGRRSMENWITPNTNDAVVDDDDWEPCTDGSDSESESSSESSSESNSESESD